MRRMFSENQIKSIAQQFGGTKLYKHTLVEEDTYTITFYSTYSQPLDMSSFNDYESLYDFLVSINCIELVSSHSKNPVFYSTDKESFFALLVDSEGRLDISLYDDWTLANTTDTVTPL